MSGSLDDILDALEERKYVLARTVVFGRIFTKPLLDWEARILWENRPTPNWEEYNVTLNANRRQYVYVHGLPVEPSKEKVRAVLDRHGWIFKDTVCDEERKPR